MPATTLPPVPHYVLPHPTKEELEWADLSIIDISKVKTAEGRAELMPVVRDAMHTEGFIYVVNHGYTKAQTDRLLDIADLAFTQVSDEEKHQLDARLGETGSFVGYKLRQFWHIDNGVRDQIEQFNMHYSVDDRQVYPKVLEPFRPEIHAWTEHNHLNVLHPILRLLARGLELPEETFVDIHQLNSDTDTWGRFMKYFPRSEEDEKNSKNVWFKGHKDTTSVSILWSQPVSALQIMSSDGRWRWVKHMENALVVNLGEVMEILSGGYYRSVIHRVVQPPPDQRGYPRLGLFYFAMAEEDVKLVPFAQSPVLQRLGITRWYADEDAPVMREMRMDRFRAYGRTALKKTEDGHEEEVIGGIVVKHYN